MPNLLLVILGVSSFIGLVFAKGVPPALPKVDKHDKKEETLSFWINKNEEILKNQLNKEENVGKAKNIILFIGDGMSLSTVTASRIYKGQRDEFPGEEQQLSFDKFPYIGLSKTYCVDKQVADSACSGTAYWSGIKSNLGTLGVTAAVKKTDKCSYVNDTTIVKTLLDWSQEAGKGTGIVTTTTVTNASPAAGYAHTPFRSFENDEDVLKKHRDPKVCPDIAQQLIKKSPGKNLNVILGGGRSNFRLKGYIGKDTNDGKRADEDLINMWLQEHNIHGNSTYVWNRDLLLKQDFENTDFLLGLFADQHLPFNLDSDKSEIPSLTEMTYAAISVLSKNENGFMLFIEGGKIDHAHHSTQAVKAIDETVEFAKAVEMAVNMTDPTDTLIVVTSDHSHGLTLNGYPGRGNDIKSFAGLSNIDRLPYTTLSYATGTNYLRHNLLDDTMDKNYRYPAAQPLKEETHSGEDIPVFAKGPWAQLYTGVYEQSFIPVGMMYAACIGPHHTLCSKN